MISYDAIVVGAGQAGPSLASRLAKAGWKIAVVERNLFGGTCVNTGCIPTKTLVASAYAAHLARRSNEYGVLLSSPVTVDMKAVKARMDRISGQSRTSVESGLRNLDNCTVYVGHAHFESATVLRVGEKRLQSQKIFLNVGGRARIPDLPGIRDISYLTNATMLDLDYLPDHIVVVGGGSIGVEYAQMYRRFGSKVTLVERGDRILATEDEDVSDAVRKFLEEEGVTVMTGAECIRFAKMPDGHGVEISGSRHIVGSEVLLAMGRLPNTDDLGLEAAGVAVDKHGYITVDDTLATSVPGIWAMGDCNGRGGFTHTSYNDFEIVAANLLDNEPRRVSDRIRAYAVYCDPPLGRVGMTKAEAAKTGRNIYTATRPMTRVGRAIEKGETNGFMQAIVDYDSKEILGAAILGVGGDEAIHCFLSAMYAKTPYPKLASAVHIHPTVSELIPTLLQSLEPLKS